MRDLEELKHNLRYAWEKYHLAVRIMVISSGDIKERLISAFDELNLPDTYNMPTEELTKLHKEVLETLRRGGSVPDTIQNMTEIEATTVAEKIFDIYATITRNEYPKLFPPS